MLMHNYYHNSIFFAYINKDKDNRNGKLLSDYLKIKLFDL